MPATAVPALAAALLLVLAGAQKVADPAMTVGALRALRLPASALTVRIGSAAEVLIGLTAVFVGGPVAWGLVALSYAAFAVFVALALRSGTMIGTCGCFGREETPPHWLHVVLDVGLSMVAIGAAVTATEPLATTLADDPGIGIVVVALAALAVGLLYAAFVELPRTLAAGRALRPGGLSSPGRDVSPS